MEAKEDILIGKVIVVLRNQRQMSQEDLCFATGLSRSYMSQLENNKSSPGLGTIFVLAYSLGMKPFELVKIIEDSPDTEFRTRKRPSFKPDK